MNSTQNKKIEQVKETTMIVGIDVGSEKHYFRAFNWRGIELTRKPVPFSNSMDGFNSFYDTIVELMQKNNLEEAMVGIEPTGHYWFDLGQFIGEKSINKLIIKTVDSFSDDIETNYVIDQDVKKSSEVDECSIITLEISKGSDKMEVPNLVGTPFNTALAANPQFIYQYQEVYSDSPIGTIIAQDLPAGEVVAYGSVINLTVSLGKELKSVPDFSKMKQPKIKKLCESLGLTYVIIREPNDSIKRNYCISQSVAPYSVITNDTCVEIHISEGPAESNTEDTNN